MKVSVVDLGFNSVKMVNYNVFHDGTFKPYAQEGVKVRLGEGLHETGYIGQDGAQRTIDALKLFRDIIKFDSIKHVLPVATSAVREAENREEFLHRVKAETGFTFQILSGREEALYSYIGALQATCFPTVLFFDIGGGSLELVYTENYSIKKILSLPLGAFRLTQMFGRRGGIFSKKGYAKMEAHILKTLPDKKDLDLSPDTTIVGVGGVLRAMTRVDQELVGYELDKIHNYRMQYADVSSIARELYRMDRDELENVKAIGSNRMETIVAGSTAISLLMQKLAFDDIVVSAEGLREGILSVFARDQRTFYRGITAEKAKAFVTFACQPETMPPFAATFISPLLAAGLLREKEKMILTHAIRELAEIPSASVTNLNNLFYMMIDEDSRFLTHREQLILALSIIYTKKGKTADWLFSRYKSILEPQNRKSIEKIAACLVISNILENARATAKVSTGSSPKDGKVEIRVVPSGKQFLPDILLANAVRNFGEAFGVDASWSLVPRLASSKRGRRVKLPGAAV